MNLEFAAIHYRATGDRIGQEPRNRGASAASETLPEAAWVPL